MRQSVFKSVFIYFSDSVNARRRLYCIDQRQRGKRWTSRGELAHYYVVTIRDKSVETNR